MFRLSRYVTIQAPELAMSLDLDLSIYDGLQLETSYNQQIGDYIVVRNSYTEYGPEFEIPVKGQVHLYHVGRIITSLTWEDDENELAWGCDFINHFLSLIEKRNKTGIKPPVKDKVKEDSVEKIYFYGSPNETKVFIPKSINYELIHRDLDEDNEEWDSILLSHENILD